MSSGLLQVFLLLAKITTIMYDFLPVLMFRFQGFFFFFLKNIKFIIPKNSLWIVPVIGVGSLSFSEDNHLKVAGSILTTGE